jgi:nicotinate phosphoribosyltransferase
LKTIQKRTKSNLTALDDTYKRLINPHVYKVSLSEKLKDLKFGMIAEYERAAYHSSSPQNGTDSQ